MLRILQGKLESIQQNLNDGIKSLRSGSLLHKGDHSSSKNIVTYHAGADLLHNYQEAWFAMHTEMENSAVSAQKVTSSISSLSVFVDKQDKLLTKLQDELVTMTKLISDITELAGVVDAIRLLEEEVNDGMVKLVNQIETLDMLKERQSHENQLQLYRIKRQSEAEKFELEAAKTHASKVLETERRRQLQQKERSQFFEEAFNQDLEFYKLFGQIEKKPAFRKSVELGEITLENDTSELDDFLKNVDNDAQAEASGFNTGSENNIKKHVKQDPIHTDYEVIKDRNKESLSNRDNEVEPDHSSFLSLQDSSSEEVDDVTTKQKSSEETDDVPTKEKSSEEADEIEKQESSSVQTEDVDTNTSVLPVKFGGKTNNFDTNTLPNPQFTNLSESRDNPIKHDVTSSLSSCHDEADGHITSNVKESTQLNEPITVPVNIESTNDE